MAASSIRADEQALIALHRFGLGARPGERAEVQRDPRGWLLAQIASTPSVPVALRRHGSGRDRVAEAVAARKGEEADRKEERKAVREAHRDAWEAEAIDRVMVAARSDRPFHERLVRFWGDVLTVSAVRAQCFGLVGPFEREVLRPGVLGTYPDLLVASTKHPAMLAYLDNERSIGPDSAQGRRRRAAGRNENLAREVLELHTLGARSGAYSQDDVLALADLLTGWGLDTDVPGVRSGRHGFGFHVDRHQPSEKILLGRRWPEGLDGGEAALRHLATHPETAQHLATRMARHFLADEPPAEVVEAVAASLRRSGGDLRAAAVALVSQEESWALPLRKVRRPEEVVIATLRAFSEQDEEAEEWLTSEEGRKRLWRVLQGMGQVPWFAPSPEGWPDSTAAWLGGDALLRRVSWADRVAARARRHEPAALAEALFGAARPAVLDEALARAPDRRTGAALVLASPLFQRR